MSYSSEMASLAPLILIVDDEPDVLRRLEKPLRKAGFRVLSLRSGVEVFACVRRERPAFILLDVMMPRMDGFEVLKLLKTDRGTASIPVGMLIGKPATLSTAKAIYGRGEFFRSDEVEFVVIKPLLKDPAELALALQQWFARRKAL